MGQSLRRPAGWLTVWALAVAALPAQADTQGALPHLDTRLRSVKSKVLRMDDDARRHRLAVGERANQVFGLLAGEMVLQAGRGDGGLAVYRAMLERTRDAEVAERAMEIALSQRDLGQAQAIFNRWRQLQPTPSGAQQRMRWEMALARGDVAAVSADLASVLAAANEHKARRIFLQMAQFGLRHPEAVAANAAAIHQAAQKHADMPEAMIADALFAANSGNQQDAVAALQRLAAADADIRPPTQLTLGLIAQNQPQVLYAFFKQSDIAALPPIWQSLYVDTLISRQQLPQAYAQLQRMLAQSPDAALYLQAAFLSVNQRAPREQTLAYLDRAYAVGDAEQKSRAAFLAATRLMDDKQTGQARVWAGKVVGADMAFDRHVLMASIEAEEGRGAAALRELAAAAALPQGKGRFYDGADLWRLRLFVLERHTAPQQALAAYRRLLAEVEKQPASPVRQARLSQLLYQRGLLYADKLQQPQSAVADLRRYVALNPGDANGLNALGYSLLSLPGRHLTEAATLIEHAHRLSPDAPHILDSLGWVHFLQGNSEAALPLLRRAHAAFPDAEVAAHLGEVLWQRGERDEALQIWRQAAERQSEHPVLRETLRRLQVVLPPPAP